MAKGLGRNSQLWNLPNVVVAKYKEMREIYSQFRKIFALKLTMIYSCVFGFRRPQIRNMDNLNPGPPNDIRLTNRKRLCCSTTRPYTPTSFQPETYILSTNWYVSQAKQTPRISCKKDRVLKRYTFPRNISHSAIAFLNLSNFSFKTSISPMSSARLRITLSRDPNVKRTLAPSNGSTSSPAR